MPDEKIPEPLDDYWAARAAPVLPTPPPPAAEEQHPPPVPVQYAKPDHPETVLALILAVVAVVGAPFSCGLSLLLAPWAMRMGRRARSAIGAAPQTWRGREKATVAYALGIIGTGLLAIAAVVAVLWVFGVASFVSNPY